MYKITVHWVFFFFINFHRLAIVAGGFIRHQNSVPKGLSAPAPGLCTYKKSWNTHTHRHTHTHTHTHTNKKTTTTKKNYKITFESDLFRNLHHLATVITGFIWLQNSVPKRWSYLALGLSTCIKYVYMLLCFIAFHWLSFLLHIVFIYILYCYPEWSLEGTNKVVQRFGIQAELWLPWQQIGENQQTLA